MLHILFSDKEDWKTKTEGKYDTSKYRFHYKNFDTLKSIRRYHMVIPLFEKDIHILNNRFKKWRYKFLIPSNDTVIFCNDKLKFNTHLCENSFTENIPEILTNTCPYPYILKKNLDEWGLNSHVIDTREKEEKLAHLTVDSNYFKQRYIEGVDEYTIHFIFANNQLQYTHTLKFTFNMKRFVKGLNSPPFTNATIISVETQFIPVFEKILQHIGYNGVGCFNYKLENNRPQIFELNPRVGGSLPLDLINFVDTHYKVVKAQASARSTWNKIKMFFLR